jgi:hypothetical protein
MNLATLDGTRAIESGSTATVPQTGTEGFNAREFFRGHALGS